MLYQDYVFQGPSPVPVPTAQPQTTIKPTETPPTTKAQSGGSFNCPRDGLFKDPAHCDMFYNCANGIAYPQNCPTGLLFDAYLKICNWPSSVQC